MMTNSSAQFGDLSDGELLGRVREAVTVERSATARLIALLAELDARRLYLGEGCSSLFTYCTQVLHLSEHAAYNRIETARAARRFPVILELVAEGALHLTARSEERRVGRERRASGGQTKPQHIDTYG